MKPFTTISRRIHALAHALECPSLFMAKMRGASIEVIGSLDKPWLHALGITEVLDIGANTGQFASAIRHVLPNARIVSFEPIPDCFARLQRNMRGDAHFCGFNRGLGDSSGQLTFKRSEFSQSSSFLPMAAVHRSAFPHTGQSADLVVEVSRLDDLAGDLALTGPVLAKIDVQGYEGRVLSGGRKTLGAASAILIETAFTSLYEGQPLFVDILHELTSWGFIYSGSLGQVESPIDGRPLWSDSIFLRQ